MSKKIDRATHGPGAGEIILGVVLSVALGVALGAVLLVLRPVVVAKETPKEPVKGAVYYIEGSKDSAKGREALAKRKAFVDGQSVSVNEAEVNSLIAANAPAAAKPAAEKGKDSAPAANANDVVVAGAPNVRIHDGEVQIGVPVTLDVLGVTQKVIFQAHGGFEKTDSGFVYAPSTLYFGSCPVQRLPFVAGYIRKKALAQQSIPEDVKTSWAKLANVSVEGSVLKLTMP